MTGSFPVIVSFVSALLGASIEHRSSHRTLKLNLKFSQPEFFLIRRTYIHTHTHTTSFNVITLTGSMFRYASILPTLHNTKTDYVSCKMPNGIR